MDGKKTKKQKNKKTKKNKKIRIFSNTFDFFILKKILSYNRKNIMDLVSTLTSPLGAQYCDYFYIIMVWTLFLLLVQILNMVYDLFTSKKLKGSEVMSHVISLASIGLYYFVMRLFYSMCAGSLQ